MTEIRSNSIVNIHGKKLTFIELAFVFLFPVLYRQFYFYNAVPNVLMRLSVYLAVLGSLAYTANYLFRRKYPNRSIPQYVRLIFVALLISAVIAFVSRGQSLMLSYRVVTPLFMGYLYFFVLYKIKPHPKVITRIIISYALLYAVCFIWAMINAPNILFGSYEEVLDESRGVFRVRVAGLQFMVLFFFYSVTQITRSYRWVIWSVISYIFIIYCLTRQVIVFSLFIAVIYLVWKRVWLRVAVALLAILALMLQSIDIKFDESSLIGNLVNYSSEQVENDGTDNIRIIAAENLSTKFHKNILEVLFGSGAAHLDSDYGKWEVKHFLSKGYVRSDLGYIGTYVTFGIFGLIIYMLMFYKALTIKNVGIYIFAQLFIYYALLTNIASWPFRSDCIEISICLYLLTLCAIRGERTLLNNTQIITHK